MHTHEILALINLAFCTVIFWACICRLNSRLCRNHIRPRVRYTLLLTGGMCSGFSPLLFDAYAGIGTAILSGCVAASLAVSAYGWPQGEPPQRRKDDE